MIKNMEKTRETEVKETSVTLAENNDKTGDEEVIKVSAVKETEDIGSGFDMFMEGRSGNAALTLDLQEAGSISYYREKMEKKEKIEIMFSVIDRYDNLFAYAGEVTVKMLNKYIRGYRSRIYNRAICLSRPYPVEVTAVDEEIQDSLCVACSSKGNTKETGSRTHNIPAGTGKKCQGKSSDNGCI